MSDSRASCCGGTLIKNHLAVLNYSMRGFIKVMDTFVRTRGRYSFQSQEFAGLVIKIVMGPADMSHIIRLQQRTAFQQPHVPCFSIADCPGRSQMRQALLQADISFNNKISAFICILRIITGYDQGKITSPVLLFSFFIRCNCFFTC